MCLSWKGGWVGHWVRMGVGCPCPPVRNDIVTPRHLFLIHMVSGMNGTQTFVYKPCLLGDMIYKSRKPRELFSVLLKKS